MLTITSVHNVIPWEQLMYSVHSTNHMKQGHSVRFKYPQHFTRDVEHFDQPNIQPNIHYKCYHMNTSEHISQIKPRKEIA